MSNFEEISDLVHAYVTFHGNAGNGWQRCYCEVCGDGSRTKGPRGGWLFQGDITFYRCFNCGISTNFGTDREFPFAEKMRDVFDAFGIPKTDYQYIAYKNKLKPLEAPKKEGDKPEVRPMSLKFFDIPSYFYPLYDAPADNEIAQAAREKLAKGWGLKPTSYPFYLSNGGRDCTDPMEKNIARSLMNRIIVPFFKNGRMIYYQARAIDDKEEKRYINLNVPKANIIFNMDVLYQNRDRPLFVFEGAMDAIHVGGVAVMEDMISAQQIEILNKSPRTKVVVPDYNQKRKRGEVGKLVELGVFREGWGLALPQLGSGTKDISEGIKRYGKLHVVKSLMDNIYFGDVAKLRAGFY
jgi:hypothetical protein